MRILIVDDEPDLLSGLAQAVRENGYAVDTAEDGEEALYKLESYDYDAAVLDIMMPKLDGFEVLKAIRETKDTPVLLLTARDALEDRISGLDLGADDYLIKPFDIDELLARLRALVRRSAGKASNVIERGKLTLDTAAKKASRDGSELTLTAREYSLIEYLLMHRGKVVSRTELYDHLFDEDDETMSNLLDVHVSNLRKKIGPDIIQTRRGQGYIIE